ncbi:NOB1 family endonuclease [Metallosphaera tengchongensis]|uniref:NOB1 family endonuclease n=1 Tax=Metallosphaera tengchongensis TaxID=1532350 RepID=A0A6N0NUK0_9CREN|nr:NOB1 family endonuclease [Metallosphaera tengchongensis]QKR00402.1 NOB1 family endonuclease [Metallosphaera tengchongensis]
MEKIIFDTAGFLGGLQNSFDKVFTTPQVVEEVKDSRSMGNLSFSIITNKIVVMEPSQSALKKVEKVLRDLNEFSLTKTDKSVIALAVDLNPAVVFTDDFAVQNVLIKLGIKFTPVRLGRTAQEIKSFSYVCESCGRTYREPKSECEVCGGKIRKTVVKQSQRRGS